MKIHRNKIAF